ncbi:hypothetical protein [Bacillus massiliigorillae]|uniref:hypothetical protein n=1 Tax=Bacillus massiliigorillae TaxID=1243664 RepID=UPI000399ADDA|nr:hypothetical protein [Bacillus massiliigorillae]
MKSLQDALYNWLSIKVVSDARPEDKAANETVAMFLKILEDDHNVSSLEITKDEDMYYVTYEKSGISHTNRFPVELIECILMSINENPARYKNYE